jgi:hypothetical protein
LVPTDEEDGTEERSCKDGEEDTEMSRRKQTVWEKEKVT